MPRDTTSGRAFLFAVVVGVLLFGVFLVRRAARSQAPPAFLLFSSEGMSERVAQLRPAIEEVLGGSLGGPVTVRAVSRAELREHFEAEVHGAGPSESGVRERLAGIEARHVVTFGTLDGATGEVLVCPSAIEDVAEGLGSDLSMADLLDLVLVHEAVHVHQAREFGLTDWAFAADSWVAGLCRRAVVEGHAEHVTRLVAAELGLSELCETMRRERPDEELRRGLEGVAAGEEVDAFALGAARALRFDHEVVYVRGEAFMAHQLALHGGDGARTIRELMRSPPGELWRITHPDLHASGFELPDLAALGARIAGVIDGDAFKAQSRVMEELELGMFFLLGAAQDPEDPRLDAALAGSLGATQVVASAGGEWIGLLLVFVVVADSPESAARLMELRTRKWAPEGAEPARRSPDAAELAVSTATGSAWLSREGTTFLEIGAPLIAVPTAELRRLAGRVRDAMRAAPGADVERWTPTEWPRAGANR